MMFNKRAMFCVLAKFALTAGKQGIPALYPR